MANFERDKDDVRVFDGGEDIDEGEGSHLPVIVIMAGLVLAAFGGVVWLAYNQGVARGHSESAAVRVATTDPAAPGGQIKVYQQRAAAEDEEEGKPAAAVQPPAPKTADPAIAKAAATPPPPNAMQAAPPVPAKVAASQPALPTVKPEALQAPPAPKQQPAASKPASIAPKPDIKLAQASPPAVATKPPARLGIPQSTAETPDTETVAPKPVAPKPAVPTVETPKAVASKVAGGSYLLQVGAYKSEAEALAAWKTYQGKHATLLTGFGPNVQRADLGDKGVWYRLRISSFADKDAAAALCERLKSQNATCFLAK